MYYVKIPLRNLCEPHELRVPKQNQQELWTNRAKGLLQDIAQGVIPAWAVDYRDLRQITLQKEEEADAVHQ